jgi:hypothetical protein
MVKPLRSFKPFLLTEMSLKAVSRALNLKENFVPIADIGQKFTDWQL